MERKLAPTTGGSKRPAPMFVWSHPRLKLLECRTSPVVLNLLFKSSKHIYYKEPLTNKEYLIMVGYSSKQNESNTVRIVSYVCVHSILTDSYVVWYVLLSFVKD